MVRLGLITFQTIIGLGQHQHKGNFMLTGIGAAINANPRGLETIILKWDFLSLQVRFVSGLIISEVGRGLVFLEER